MLRYVTLPKKTSRRTWAAVIVCGICLGLALFVMGFIALYAFVGLFSLYFYPASHLILSNSDLAILILIATAATVATTMLGFLAYYMNKLASKALPLSRIVWIPMLTTVTLVLWQRTSTKFTYHMSWGWLWLAYEAVLFAGVVPAVFLHTRAGRELHNRKIDRP